MREAGVIVVGAGQAAASLASKLRAEGYERPITLVGAEPHLPYQRPPLSKGYLLGKQGFDHLLLRPRDFYSEADVTLALGTRVLAIRPQARQILIEGGATLPYEHLVLATGASARQWPAALGGALEGVHTLRQIEDADALRQDLDTRTSLLIIGGGYIGLEIAAAASSRGVAVTIIEALPRILNRVAGEETAGHFRDLHLRNGVRIYEAMSLRRLLGQGRVEAAELEGGELLPCDMVLAGIGAMPNVELAKEAGLQVADGIVTDAFGRTSAPSIWSAGDCATVSLDGNTLRLESVGNAIDQAETVAMNILGRETRYKPRPWFWTEQFSTRMQIAGLSSGFDETVVRTIPDKAKWSCWYFRDSALIAADAVNDPQAYLAARRMLETGMSVPPDVLRDPATEIGLLGRTSAPR